MKRFMAVWAVMAMWTAMGCIADVERGDDDDGAGGMASFDSSIGEFGEDSAYDEGEKLDAELQTQAAGNASCEANCAAGFEVFRAFCNSKHVPKEKKQLCWKATNDYTAACVKEKAVPGCAPSCGKGYLVFARFCEASLNTKSCEKISRLSATKCLHPD